MQMQAYLALLNFALFTVLILCFVQIESVWQPCIELSLLAQFSNSIWLLRVSVSHFGISLLLYLLW